MELFFLNILQILIGIILLISILFLGCVERVPEERIIEERTIERTTYTTSISTQSTSNEIDSNSNGYVTYQSNTIEITGNNIQENIRNQEPVNLDLTGNYIEIVVEKGTIISNIEMTGNYITVYLPNGQHPSIDKVGNYLSVEYY